jgi:alkanesulfonate monooxygenase SsuD/methylene tetrahydromethanopterin reductase-like flavin-dependent oxidoreductase (luciferase family)
MHPPVNFGLWYDFRNPPSSGRPFEAFYRETLDQIVEAERLGFDSVWLTEHHFCDDGYTPSPLVIAAAIGARTRTMRIGTNLMILPLHNPLRIAEDAATLSILTGGRFDLGVGLGYRQLEFETFGRELRFRPSLMEEAVEIIRRAWSGKPISFSGKRFEVGDVRITPVPERVPRLFMGGMAEPAIERVARIADGFLSTGGIGEDIYIDKVRLLGKDPAKATIIAGHWAIVSDDPDAEARAVGPYVLYQANAYIEWGAFGPPETTPRFPDAAAAIENGLYQLWDPDTAVKRLVAHLEAHPKIRDMHFWAQFPGEPIAQGQKRVELLATRVLPQVRARLGLVAA